MATPANTSSSSKYSTLREDLSDKVYDISPTDTPAMQFVGRDGKWTQKHHEWSQTAIEAADDDTANYEGADVSNGAVVTPTRLGNYAMLMDRVAAVTSSAQKSKVAGDVQKMAKQVLFKVANLKLSMEKRLLSNKAAIPGDDSTIGKTAGIGCFLRTNVSRGAGGANPTLSGSTTGYPNAAPTDGTQREFTEDLLKPVIQAQWDNGANPTHMFVGSWNKMVASTFTGNAQKTKDAKDKKIVAAISVYESDFGTLQIVPSRQTVSRQALILDKRYVRIGYLQPMHNFDLAKTGHSDRRAVAVEWGVQVDVEKAHGIIADLTTA